MQGGVGHSRSRTLDRTTFHTYTATTNAREPSSGEHIATAWSALQAGRRVHGSLVLSDGNAVPRRVDELVALAEVVVHR